MKKFCSECGHPLEISKKFCSECGSANPFFTLSLELPNARSSAIDALLARKESIERELEEIKREQEDALRKEKFRAEMEELERQRLARIEKEKEIKERFEREKIEAAFKQELQQVKSETEQYKQQTTHLLKELQQVIFQIDEENRKLKEELLQIAKAQQQAFQPATKKNIAPTTEEPTIPSTVETTFINENQPAAQPPLPKKATQKRTTAITALLFFALAAAIITIGYFYFTHQNQNNPEKTITEKIITTTEPTTASEPNPEPTSITESQPVTTTETNTSITASTPALPPSSNKTKEKAKPVIAAPTSAETTKETPPAFGLSAEQARADLIGQKLSGCGITLSNSSEIQQISNPVMVENTPAAGYVKYKLTMHIIQSGETYHVTPYLYYSTAGKFMRVDASNCE